MNVRSIQLALKSLGFEPGTIDGIWGRNTSTAVREFQVNKGLTPTGIVDPQTEQAIARAGGTLPDTSALVWFEEARRLMGTKEVAGPASNPVILDWAKNLDLNYPDDDILVRTVRRSLHRGYTAARTFAKQSAGRAELEQVRQTG
jgi:sulfite reductase alpha subunit-like flavoprotein